MATSTCTTIVASFGNYWGSGFGGAYSFEEGGSAPTFGPFDLFCFCGGAITSLPGFLNVEATPGDVAHGFPDTVEDGYYLFSDDGTPSNIFVDQSLGTTVSLEAVFRADSLPSDFSTATHRVFLGSYDDSLFCQGLFITQVGLAFGGAYDDNPLVLSDSSSLVQAGETYVMRLVLSGEQQAVYVYWSTQAEAEILGGPVLRYTLPLLASASVPSHQEGVYVDVLGTLGSPCQIVLRALCASSALLVDNMPPKANPGPDQVVAGCSVIRLDGSGSTDPEGGPLSYFWRVIDAPEESRYVDSGGDGHTAEDVDGFVSKLYSVHAGAPAAFEFAEGDVLMLNGVPYSLVSAGSDMGGDYFLVLGDVLPAGLSGQSFKIVRQGGFTVSTEVVATYLPDVLGIYRFDLKVQDASLFSPATEVLVNVTSVNAPRGVTPDASFVWNYMSDVSRLLEDGERVEVVWSGIMQVIGAELLHLWEVDYGKSLKDIQRTVARRWLHYDLLLREPFPYLTLSRSLWTGLLSSALDPSGLSLGGQVLVLSIPYRSQLVTITAQAMHTSPPQLAAYLQAQLQAVDERFSVSIVNVGASRKVRLYAPFPFTVVVGTTLPWTTGTSNAPLTGSGASWPTASSLKVGMPLTGIPLSPYDILVLKTSSGCVLNAVDSVQDVVGDTHRHERIQLKDPVPSGFTGEWAFAFQLKSPQLNMWEGQVHPGDPVVVEVADEQGSVTHLRVPALGAREDNKRVVALYPDETLTPYLADTRRFDVRLWGVYRKTALPVDTLVRNIPHLQRLIRDNSEDEVLRENLDYRIQQSRGVPAVVFSSVWVGDPIPRLWAEYTYLDNSPTIESNFGEAVGMKVADLAKVAPTLDYLSAVRGLWYAFFRGSRVANLRTGAQILLGLPFAEQDGTILDIDTVYSSRSGRIVVQDKSAPNLVRSYTYPRVLGLETSPVTGLPYQQGDTVAQFAPLVRGVEVVDYVNDPQWLTPFLNQGLLHETDKFHRFLVRVDLEAFSLPSLLFIKAFLSRIKPLRVRPLFLARKVNDATDTVDVTDQLKATLKLVLFDSPHARRTWAADDVPPGPLLQRSSAAMFDQPDPSPGVNNVDGAPFPTGYKDGHVSNAFDVGLDPDNEPTSPDADVGTDWGFDVMHIRPETHITGLVSLNYDGIAAMTLFESLASADQPVLTAHPINFGQQWIPAVLNGIQIREPQAPPANYTVNYAELTVRGNPPGGGHDYTLDVYKNDVLVLTLPFTHSSEDQRISWGPAPAPSALPAAAFAVTTSDTIKVVLTSAEPTPALYVLKSITLVLGPAIGWSSGGPALPAATYYVMRTL